MDISYKNSEIMYYIVKISTSRFLDIMNPFTGKIVSRSSYNEIITSEGFKKAVSNGIINLYANSCSPLDENGQIKEIIIEKEFVKKYKLGTVYNVTSDYIEVYINPKLDKEIVDYILDNADKCSAGVFGACSERMEGLDCVSDIYCISGYQLYDAQYRPLIDIIFKLGETYEERCRKYNET